MNRIKRVISATALLSVLIMTGASAFADEFVYIDLNKISDGYTKAKEADTEMKTKESELQKFLADAKKQVSSAKTKNEAKLLEDKYDKELQKRVADFKQAEQVKIESLESNILSGVKAVADSKGYKTVLRKESVIYGGTDITDDVLTVLNSK